MGRSFKWPLSGTLLTTWHFGHLIVSRPWLDLWQRFKHCRQKLWRHRSCFGSVYMLIHTGQETSLRRLWSNVLISMVRPSCLRREREQWLRVRLRVRIWLETMNSYEFVLFCFFPFVSFFGICYSCFFHCISQSGILVSKACHGMSCHEYWFPRISPPGIWLLLISFCRQVILLSCWRGEFAFNHKFCLLSFEKTDKFHK